MAEPDSQKVWIVGQTLDSSACAWHFQGVFQTEQEAVAACLHPNYFVGPAILGQALPHTETPWVGAYYPSQAQHDAG